MSSKNRLIAGAEILEEVLSNYEFRFRLTRHGYGSGGGFASGEFVRADRKIELHFRESLGRIRYHVGEKSASHENYMRQLGVWDRCNYPGFSANPMHAFNGLAHDVLFAEDFLTGTGKVLIVAAAKEQADMLQREKLALADCAGDSKTRERLRSCFHAGNYLEVLRIIEDLKFPEFLPDSERQMIEIARKRNSK